MYTSQFILQLHYSIYKHFLVCIVGASELADTLVFMLELSMFTFQLPHFLA